MKSTILYLCGSDENERLFMTNIMYSSGFNDFGLYNVINAVIQPNFKVCFPEKIEFRSIKEAVKYDICKAMNIIKNSSINVVISNTYGSLSCTNLRAMLELLEIPIIGSNSVAHYITNNKFLCQSVLEANGIRVPLRYETHKDNLEESLLLAEKIGYPLVVKCATLDDSKGVFFVREKSEIKNVIIKAFNLCQTVFLEKFIEGKEVRCSVVENEHDNKFIPPIFQYLIDEKEVRTFDKKLNILENGEMEKVKNVYIFLDESKHPDITKKVKEMALKVFQILKLQDFMLVDIRIDKSGQPFVLEVNLFCSFGETSNLNAMIREANITDKQFLEMAVNRALNRSRKCLI